MAQPNKLVFIAVLAVQMAGCANLLPPMNGELRTPLADFDRANRGFDQLVPYASTLQALRKLGFGSAHLANLQVLNQAQVAQATLPSPLQDGATVPQGIVDCMRAGYAMDASSMEHRRAGKLVLSLRNFRRDTVTTGWKFAALIGVINETVVYKQWS